MMTKSDIVLSGQVGLIAAALLIEFVIGSKSVKSVSMEPSGDEYDEETDTYMGNRDIHAEDGPNIFVDSEFIVSDVDMEKGVLIVEPFSLRGKGIMVEINPDHVEEVFVK